MKLHNNNSCYSSVLCSWSWATASAMLTLTMHPWMLKDGVHTVCRIQRHLRFHGKPEIGFFKDTPFAEFRMSLDAEMKCLQRCGLGSKRKKAESISCEEEEALWQKGVLGSSNPQSLVDTMLYMCRIFFALRSEEHRQLRFHQSHIQLVERQLYLQYTEYISKNRQGGGLKNRKLKPKVVVRYANEQNSERCFIRLFKRYESLSDGELEKVCVLSTATEESYKAVLVFS